MVKLLVFSTEVSLGEKQLLRGAGDLGLAQRLSGFSSDKMDNFIIINITVILRDTEGVFIIVLNEIVHRLCLVVAVLFNIRRFVCFFFQCLN